MACRPTEGNKMSHILSTYQLHTFSSWCGKREAHIDWSIVTCKAAPVTRTTSRTTGPVSADSRQFRYAIASLDKL